MWAIKFIQGLVYLWKNGLESLYRFGCRTISKAWFFVTPHFLEKNKKIAWYWNKSIPLLEIIFWSKRSNNGSFWFQIFKYFVCYSDSDSHVTKMFDLSALLEKTVHIFKLTLFVLSCLLTIPVFPWFTYGVRKLINLRAKSGIPRYWFNG